MRSYSAILLAFAPLMTAVAAVDCTITCDNLGVKTEDATDVINEINGHNHPGDEYKCCNGNTMGSACTTLESVGTASAGICDPRRCIRGVDSPTGQEFQDHIYCLDYVGILTAIQNQCLQNGMTGGKCESDVTKVILFNG